jgi:hypothetical protein
MDEPTIAIYDLGEYGYVDADGNVIWAKTSTVPTHARLAALEVQVAELHRKLDDLTAYVQSLMTSDQRLRCTVPSGK